MAARATFANPRTPVPTNLKLDAHYTERTRDGMSFGTTATTFVLGALTIQVPCPFVPIDDHLGITPAITPDGDTALRIDLTRWSPLYFGPRGVRSFPFNFTGQDFATKACRAFDTDPSTTWWNTPAEIQAWLRGWGPANGLHL